MFFSGKRSFRLLFNRAFTALALCALAFPALAKEELIELTPRAGSRTLALLTHEPDRKPVAIAVLLPGGTGQFDFQTGAFGVRMRNEARLPNRLRPLLLAQGVASLMVDSPADKPEMDDVFRTSATHMGDLAAVLDAAATRFPGVPVILVGHSNGTISASHFAATAGARLQAVMLVASRLVATPQLGAGLSQFDWTTVQTKLMLVHHRFDDCFATPYKGAVDLAANVSRFTLLTVDPAGSRASGGCTFAGTHNLAGHEVRVADAIAAAVR